jgi:hypothetical protein
MSSKLGLFTDLQMDVPLFQPVKSLSITAPAPEQTKPDVTAMSV